MQVEHAKGFVTQYHFKDKIFEDSLKPAPNEHRMLRTTSKEAFMKVDGRVLVRDKKIINKTTGQASFPSVSIGHNQADEYGVRNQSQNQSKHAKDKGMRQASSAYISIADPHSITAVTATTHG